MPTEDRAGVQYDWHEAESFLKEQGWVGVERFGPCHLIVMQRAGGLSGPAGEAVARRLPWAVLARFAHAKSRVPSLLFLPSGPQDSPSVARIYARAPGLIVFAHPSGQTFAVIEEERVIKATPPNANDHEWYEWVTKSQPEPWAAGEFQAWSLDDKHSIEW
jgi:hypothetical protein